MNRDAVSSVEEVNYVRLPKRRIEMHSHQRGYSTPTSERTILTTSKEARITNQITLVSMIFELG